LFKKILTKQLAVMKKRMQLVAMPAMREIFFTFLLILFFPWDKF